jgi:hypothetical protein
MAKVLTLAALLVSLAVIVALPASAQAWSVSPTCGIEGGVPESELGAADGQSLACENAKRATEQAALAAAEAERTAKEKAKWEAECRAGQPELQEATWCKAQRADETATEEAKLHSEYEAAVSRADTSPVTYLSVRATAEPEPKATSRNPGATELVVRATDFAHVTVTLTRYGHLAYRFVDGGTFENAQEVGQSYRASNPREYLPTVEEYGLPVGWSCRSPGGAYHYVVTARSNVGPTLTRRGTFKTISVARCHELKRHEQEARERNARRYNEEVAHRERVEREELRREEANCRTLNGTPVTVQTGEGPERVCRGPERYVPL